MPASDFRINSMVRSVLARHWIDLQKIVIGSFRGTVRLTGELCHIGNDGVRVPEPRQLDNVEAEIRAIPEVERVYFDLSNWHRTSRGDWVSTNRPSVQSASGVSYVDDRGTPTWLMNVRPPSDPSRNSPGEKR